MQESLPHIEAAGGRLVAVTPDGPDESITMIEKHSLAFEVLSDNGNKLADQFGIRYVLTDELDKLFLSFGIDLKKRYGTEESELPLATTYVIDRDGIIRWAFLEVDYTKRAEPADIIAALKQL